MLKRGNNSGRREQNGQVKYIQVLSALTTYVNTGGGGGGGGGVRIRD